MVGLSSSRVLLPRSVWKSEPHWNQAKKRAESNSKNRFNVNGVIICDKTGLGTLEHARSYLSWS